MTGHPYPRFSGPRIGYSSELLKDISRNGASDGIVKPEPLIGELN